METSQEVVLGSQLLSYVGPLDLAFWNSIAVKAMK